ncbi:MAG: Na+/H+ antiporter subunit E [Chloroflexi bacterium]|nr:Na+/H+ antiporter subunit E [Chloroflexota bacterium]
MPMKIGVRLLLAIILAVAWVLLTGQVNLFGFLFGYALGFLILGVLRNEHLGDSWSIRRLPDQVLAFVLYTLIMLKDIAVSSIDVTRRVLSPRMPLASGIVAIEVDDESTHQLMAALSAHSINLTPGEMVVDFDGTKTMYVHALDVHDCLANEQAGAQITRVKWFKRILGL